MTIVLKNKETLLKSLDEKPKQKWNLDLLPLNRPEKLQPIPRVKTKVDLIKKLSKRDDVESLINACDAGREGELIYHQVISYLKIKKPSKRLWLQSMTKDGISKAFTSIQIAIASFAT